MPHGVNPWEMGGARPGCPGLGNPDDCEDTQACAHHSDCAASAKDTESGYCAECGKAAADACSCKEAAIQCWKTQAPFFQCCCQCVFRVKDFSHPTSDGKPASRFKSYVCIGLLIEDRFHVESGVHSEWPEHSCTCEMYQKREVAACPK